MTLMTPRSAKPSAEGIGWLRDKLVLLAEDNVTNQMVATQMLDALGARVDVANDGAEALEMMGARRYDLFLIDIEMPRVSGLDVIRSIRASKAPLCDAPVIAVTAYALREHREKITEAGADGLIPKPLLGIEQFGRDIVALADRAAVYSGHATPVEPDVDQEAQGEGPVNTAIYDALRGAIGAGAMGELLTKIDSDLDAAEKRLGKALQDRELGEIAAASHILISVSGAIGATTLQSLAQQSNDVARGRKEGDAVALGRAAVTQIDDVREFIRTQLQGMKV
jgi:CheY-like chemotaxis protein